MFSTLTSMDVLEGSRVLDLFAGSGALGIEALSRGAESAVLVDDDPDALAVIRSNLDVLGADAVRATVVRSEVLSYLSGAPAVDLVLADPPYDFAEWPALLALLADRAELVVAETATEWKAGPGWETVKQKRYGGTVVTIVQRVPAPAESRTHAASQEGES
jgi:16S rRNA (guanine966-N2)-methyltransferase